MLGERVAYAAVSQHLYILSYIQARRYPPLRKLLSDFGDFSTGVSHVMKMTVSVMEFVMS